MTVDEVAAELGCSAKSVRRLISRQELVAYRVGRVIRVEAAEVERYRRGHPAAAPMAVTGTGLAVRDRLAEAKMRRKVR
jgi:excisionase family DNA binding protein